MSESIERERNAVEELQAVTRRLLDTVVSDGGTSSLFDLLNARSAACAELARLIESGFQLSSADLERILTLQAECEETLRKAVEDTLRRLRELAGKRKVRSAYSGGADTGGPCFVDKRR